MRQISNSRKNAASWAQSLLFQTLITLVVAVCIPALILYPGTLPFRSSNQPVTNTFVGAVFATVLAIYLIRRVTAFPGARSFSFVAPSFAATYGIVLALFFSFRFDYGRLYFGISFAVGLVVAYAISFLIERFVVPSFYVVPFGDVGRLAAIRHVRWIELRKPTIPDDRRPAFAVDLHYDLDPSWEQMLARAAVRGCPVYHVKQLRESLTGRVTIEHLSENSFGSLLPNLVYVKAKRLVDVALCAVLLPVLAVPGALLALFIKLDSFGPVFFLQERMGYQGRTFLMIKFRTMTPRPAASTQEGERLDAITQEEDGRITRIGRVLRKTRLDELPQLLNVLAGQMSLIGPRPEAVALSRWYEAEVPFYIYRHIVRPGITGWAQVNQGHVTDLDSIKQKLEYDFYYIKNFSSWLDILIALRTLPTMISGLGAK